MRGGILRPQVWLQLAVGLGFAVQAQAGCRSGAPTGHFAGSAVSKQAGELSVTLDLRCERGRYGGELVTPVGKFSIHEGSWESGRLQLSLVGDGGEVRLDAVLGSGARLRGGFTSGDDSGTLDLRRLGAPRAAPLPGARMPKLTVAQWRQDLTFFATELPKRHANAFHHLSRDVFQREIAALDRRLGELDSDAVYFGLDRIANLIGDAHTFIAIPDDCANFPIDVRRFGEDYRVVAVADGHLEALGARVVKIDDTPIGEARERLMALTPADETPELAESRVEGFLTTGMLLHGAGITADRDRARYALVDDSGKEVVIEVRAVPPEGSAKLDWRTVLQNQQPLYRQRPGESFWSTFLAESRTVYCSFRGYADIAKGAATLLAMIERERPARVVVDLRQNGGGDYLQGLKHVIRPLAKRPDVNRRGHLFVLIGPATFSAGMSNAAQFRSQTAAILVGQTIGERPNSYQEAREIDLPNSHLKLRYSTRYYEFAPGGDNVVRPDHEIVPTWGEYRSGRDPVLEWVLRYGR